VHEGGGSTAKIDRVHTFIPGVIRGRSDFKLQCIQERILQLLRCQGKKITIVAFMLAKGDMDVNSGQGIIFSG